MTAKQPTILVCDDEPNVQAAIRLVLEDDYDLAFASDGEEALRQFQAHPADLVLLDLKMPKKDGMEVLQDLMATQPPPRILLLTAYQSVELAQQTTRYGALDYLPKPFTRPQLLTAVQRALGLPAWQRPAPAS